MRRLPFLPTLLLFAALTTACGGEPAPRASGETPPVPPSLLLVTLDTTRADAMGWETDRVATPSLEALAERGVVYRQAYTTAPTTLPAHASMLTGLYPAEHGIHENARYLSPDQELLAERLSRRGYRTAAVISGLPLSSQFGIGRGFEIYDDELDASRGERDGRSTTERALEILEKPSEKPLFLWVHYFDPHEPYAPPEPFASQYPGEPYLGEIAAMDLQVGRLLAAFEAREEGREWRLIVAGDHGEALGEHGEKRHGNLLYQAVMRVPLIVAGSGIPPGTHDQPVSVRRVFDTLLEFAGESREADLLSGYEETVLGEAMKPFLQYGWQPQVMAVRGDLKVIRAGGLEIYDVVDDPAETADLEGRVRPPRELVEPLLDYPLPTPGAAPPADDLSPDDRQKLAALGYVSWGGETVLRPDAPAPREMTDLFADLDRGSALFVAGDYARARQVFARVLERDPENLMVVVRLAVARSILGDDEAALELFERARRISPESVDVRHYLALHLLRTGRPDEAAALLETVLAASPDRLPALDALARIREAEGRPAEAARLLERVASRERDPGPTLAKLGALRMAAADTPGAIRAFERARSLIGDQAFRHDLELGVLYLANREPARARAALDRVPETHPAYPMALFKRAQVSVLLREPDREARVRVAWRRADEVTRPLIEREALFRDIDFR